MPSLNKLEIIGNIGSDPEMRFAPSGKAVTNFRVATNNRYTTHDGEKKESTEWFTVVAWGKTAELCNQYLHKGSTVYAEGRVQGRSWQGSDGQMRYRMELVANRVLFLDKISQPAAVNQAPEGETDGDITPEEIPF